MTVDYLIFDPINFRGGSKVAVETIITEAPFANLTAHVLSNDRTSWSAPIFKRYSFKFPSILTTKIHGIPFMLKHLIYCWHIFWFVLRRPQINILFATSGPGIDLGLYMAKYFLSLFRSVTLVQLIQGPVALSGLSAKCLAIADKIFYLPNTLSDLQQLQMRLSKSNAVDKDPRYEPLLNGLARRSWPSVTRARQPRALWAASNLKWKGLDVWLEALKNLNQESIQLPADICYIDASDQGMAVSPTEVAISGVRWFEMPNNLDDIRRDCSIFISTSTNEPFGLSILEALAAGLCVFIPHDGAYWDQMLEHKVNCIKYQPNNTKSLTSSLINCLEHPNEITRIGHQGQQMAQDYRARKRYDNIYQQLAKEVTNEVYQGSS